MNLITSLTNNPEVLKVRQVESITEILKSKNLTSSALFSPSIASSISQKLEANVFIQGNINQSGPTIRLNARIIESKTRDLVKSFQVDGIADSILPIIKSLSIKIRNSLIISVLNLKNSVSMRLGSTNLPTTSPEAFEYYVYGKNAALKADWSTATNFYLQSIKIDTNFIAPYLALVSSYNIPGLGNEAKKWALKAYEKGINCRP